MAEPEEKVDLEARMTQLQKDLEDEKKKTSDAQTALKQKTKEARQHQRNVDRLTLQVTNRKVDPPQPTKVPAGRKPATPSTTPPPPPQDELVEFANDQAKQVLLLRAVLDRELSMEDVEDIEFSSPTELNLILDSIQQQKEIAELKIAVEAQQEAEPPSAPNIDTGGPTSPVVPGTQVQEEYRKKAADLKRSGKYQQASWTLLRAIHQDAEQEIQVEA